MVNKVRLIDSDVLDSVVLDLNTNRNAGITRGEYKLIDSVLFEFPTVDAVPVVHGKWIDLRQEGDSRFMCSVCKWKEHVPTCMGKPTVWEYCPSCGARMDGDNGG